MSELFSRLLAARGLSKDFLCPKYEEGLDSDLLPDMQKVVERVRQAVEQGEKVLVYGDYDVDGVTASAVMHDALKMAGVKEIEVMLPNRFTDGYGISKRLVDTLADLSPDERPLVVTVDCGSRNHEVITELKRLGVDTIVTDHHECGETLPEAVAVVNPKRTDVEVPAELRELAGVGVAFKVAQALVKAGMIPAGQEKWLLDLVAIGTICDSMVLTGENRRLCRFGMVVLEKTRRPGLKELMRVAGVNALGVDAIGFQIGPRLNAAGRMDSAEKALELVMTDSKPLAAQLALVLDDYNKRRRRQQEAAVREIEARGVSAEPVIVERGKWHEGVIGIIAGRLTEQYRKPAFVFSDETALLKGSGRSFGEFNLAEALKACEGCIVGGGGHAAACGVSLKAEQFESFKTAVNRYYKDLCLQDQERFLRQKADLEVEDFTELSLELIEEMRQLEPYGPGNPMPVFLLPGVRVVEAAKLGEDGKHLRLTVWDRNGRNLKLIWFSAPEKWLKLQEGAIVDAWITLEENVYRGLRSVEGRIVRLGES